MDVRRETVWELNVFKTRKKERKKEGRSRQRESVYGLRGAAVSFGVKF